MTNENNSSFNTNAMQCLNNTEKLNKGE